MHQPTTEGKLLNAIITTNELRKQLTELLPETTGELAHDASHTLYYLQKLNKELTEQYLDHEHPAT